MDKQKLKRLKQLKQEQKAKAKPFKTMSKPEKDELLETIAKMLGLIDQGENNNQQHTLKGGK